MKSKMPSKKVAVNSIPTNNAVNLNSFSNANQQMLVNMQAPQMQMQMKPVQQVQSNVQTSTPIPPQVRSVRGGVYGARRNVP